MILHHSFVNFLKTLESADWIALVSIIINALLAIWIIKTVQNKLANKRVLKDHLISEIKDIRFEYRNMFQQLTNDKLRPQGVVPWFKLMNIRTKDLLSIANDKYNVKEDILEPYQIELRKVITELQEFIDCYKKNNKICLSPPSKGLIIKFQQRHNKIFNMLIIAVNDSD